MDGPAGSYFPADCPPLFYLQEFPAGVATQTCRYFINSTFDRQPTAGRVDFKDLSRREQSQFMLKHPGYASGTILNFLCPIAFKVFVNCSLKQF